MEVLYLHLPKAFKVQMQNIGRSNDTFKEIIKNTIPCTIPRKTSYLQIKLFFQIMQYLIYIPMSKTIEENMHSI